MSLELMVVDEISEWLNAAMAIARCPNNARH